MKHIIEILILFSDHRRYGGLPVGFVFVCVCRALQVLKCNLNSQYAISPAALSVSSMSKKCVSNVLKVCIYFRHIFSLNPKLVVESC